MADTDSGTRTHSIGDSATQSRAAATVWGAGALKMALSWVASNATDLIIVSSLAALALIHRLETLEPVNTGGDVAIKWQFVREWFYPHDYSHAEWNHHMTRFGVLVPAYVAQCLLGHGLRAYYAAPLAACLVQILAVYGLGKRLAGRFAGVLAALALTYSGVMAIAGSQLLPDLFTGAYGIVMTYLYVRFAEAHGRPRLAWLTACGVTAFVGYLAKETMVFFYPGMALAIWLAARKPKELVIFCGVLLIGVILETLAYRTFTQYSNRFSLVVASHIGTGDSATRVGTTFWGLFERYRHMDKPWVPAFYLFLPCWLGVLGFARDYRARGMLSVVASFFFFLTFVVRGINPMLLWQRFMSRYLDPTAPFVALVVGLFVALVAEQVWQRRSAGARAAWTRLTSLKRVSAVIVLLLCAGLAWSSHSETRGRRSPFVLGSELASVADDTYRRNLPIIIRRRREKSNYARSVDTLYSVYMNMSALAKNGKLPTFDEAKRLTGSLTYLVKDPNSYDADKVSRLIAADCALEVREVGSTMAVSPETDLPPACDALAAN